MLYPTNLLLYKFNVLFILVVVSNPIQSKIDKVDNEYEVEEVYHDDDLLLENTFQEPTSDNIYQNESTLPDKDLFCLYFYFLLYIYLQLVYYIFNSLFFSETSCAKYTPGLLRQSKSAPLSFSRKLKEDNVEVSESGYY